MGRMTAPSDFDFYAEQERYDHGVLFHCEDCGEPFEVAYQDGPPIGRPLCVYCIAELEEQRRRDTLRQWVELQKVGRS